MTQEEVMEQVREKIAKREAEKYPYFKVWDYLDDADKAPFLEDVDQILPLFEELEKKHKKEMLMLEGYMEVAKESAIKEAWSRGYDQAALNYTSKGEKDRIEEAKKQERWNVGEELCVLIGNKMLEDISPH